MCPPTHFLTLSSSFSPLKIPSSPSTLPSLFPASLLVILKPSCGKWVDQVLMGLFLCMGSALQLTFYHVETAARIYCPIQDPSWTDYFTLRMFECYRQFN